MATPLDLSYCVDCCSLYFDLMDIMEMSLMEEEVKREKYIKKLIERINLEKFDVKYSRVGNGTPALRSLRSIESTCGGKCVAF